MLQGLEINIIINKLSALLQALKYRVAVTEIIINTLFPEL